MDKRTLIEDINQERYQHAKKKISALGILVFEVDNKTLTFHHNDHDVLFYPYTGWHTGKSIKDGRGLKNLLKQLI